MCSSAEAKEVPESSIWHGAISAEDAHLVRQRHKEKVEEWLDFADFASELFKLHEKYGIEAGDEGYAAYRDHIRANYYQRLETYGPSADPLDEGCDCIFCNMHAEETDTKNGRESVAKPAIDGEPHVTTECNSQTEDGLQQVPAELPSASDAAADWGPDSDWRRGDERRSKKREPVSVYDDYEEAPDDTARYDSVGGVEPDWGEKKNSSQPISTCVYPPPHLPGRLPARSPPDWEWPVDRKRQEKKTGSRFQPSVSTYAIASRAMRRRPLEIDSANRPVPTGEFSPRLIFVYNSCYEIRNGLFPTVSYFRERHYQASATWRFACAGQSAIGHCDLCPPLRSW